MKCGQTRENGLGGWKWWAKSDFVWFLPKMKQFSESYKFIRMADDLHGLWHLMAGIPIRIFRNFSPLQMWPPISTKCAFAFFCSPAL